MKIKSFLLIAACSALIVSCSDKKDSNGEGGNKEGTEQNANNGGNQNVNGAVNNDGKGAGMVESNSNTYSYESSSPEFAEIAAAIDNANNSDEIEALGSKIFEYLQSGKLTEEDVKELRFIAQAKEQMFGNGNSYAVDDFDFDGLNSHMEDAKDRFEGVSHEAMSHSVGEDYDDEPDMSGFGMGFEESDFDF